MPAPTVYVYTALELVTAAKMNNDGDQLQIALDAVYEPAIYGFMVNADVALQTGDDKVRFRIPAKMNGWTITSVAASRKSGTGVPTIQIRNVTDAVDVLSTRITIDSGETDSSTAATPAVINTANDDVATGDQFAIDIDVAGTDTLFLWVEIGITRP